MGAGTAALGAVGGLSGCSAIQDLIPGGGGLGAYTKWTYAPDTFKSDQESLSLGATSYKSILSNSGKIDEDRRESIVTRNYPDLGISAEDIALELNLPQGRVITGSFDTDAAKSELTASKASTPENSFGNSFTGSTEYESDGEYEGWEIFVQSEPDTSPNAYAIGNGNILEAQYVTNSSNDASEVEAPDVAEGMIDTGTNGDNRYVDNNDTFSTLTDKLDNGVSLSVNMPQYEVGSEDGANENIPAGNFEGVVATGQSTSINGGTTKVKWVYVYDSEGDVNQGDVDEWIEANNTGEGSLSNYNDLSSSTDGNVATVTGKIPTFAY